MMPFGIDPKQITQAAQDIADVKLQQAVMDAKLDQILADVTNHGPAPQARYKTGKLAPKHNLKTIVFEDILLATALPAPPEKRFWEYKIQPDMIGMYGNDAMGDCVLAMIAHHIMLITAHTGRLIMPEMADIVRAYSELSGYDPLTGAND